MIDEFQWTQLDNNKKKVSLQWQHQMWKLFDRGCEPVDLNDFLSFLDSYLIERAEGSGSLDKDGEYTDNNPLKELFSVGGLFRGGKIEQEKELAIDLAESTTIALKRHASEENLFHRTLTHIS